MTRQYVELHLHPSGDSLFIDVEDIQAFHGLGLGSTVCASEDWDVVEDVETVRQRVAAALELVDED